MSVLGGGGILSYSTACKPCYKEARKIPVRETMKYISDLCLVADERTHTDHHTNSVQAEGSH
eukprot:121930-Amorphochlora_amoeboformis.AAC.2